MYLLLAAAPANAVPSPSLKDIFLQNTYLDNHMVKNMDITFVGADLTHMKMENGDEHIYDSVNFTNADFTGSDIKHALLEWSIFTAATFVGANIKQCGVEGAIFFKADLRNVTADGIRCGLSYGQGTNFNEANLGNASLYGSDLTQATFLKANFTAANLKEAILDGSDFTEADFTRADLSKIDHFIGADFTRAIFKNADLSNSNLKLGNFTGADFTGANITGTKFEHATVAGAIGIPAPTPPPTPPPPSTPSLGSGSGSGSAESWPHPTPLDEECTGCGSVCAIEHNCTSARALYAQNCCDNGTLPTEHIHCHRGTVSTTCHELKVSYFDANCSCSKL